MGVIVEPPGSGEVVEWQKAILEVKGAGDSGELTKLRWFGRIMGNYWCVSGRVQKFENVEIKSF